MAITHRKIRSSILRLVGMTLLLPMITTQGCIYLQDQASLKTVQDANTKFGDFKKNSSTVYDSMLANENTFAKEVETAETLAVVQNDAAISNSLPILTWSDLRSGISNYDSALTSIQASLSKDLSNILEAEQLGTINKDQLDDGLARVDSRLQEVVANRNRLETDRVLFLATIQASTTFQGSQDPANAIKTATPSILTTKVNILSASQGQVSSTTSTLADQLSGQGTDITSVIKGGMVSQFDPKSQPGLSIVILSLASDLASAEAKIATLQLTYYSQIELAVRSAEKEAQLRKPQTDAALTVLDRLQRSAAPESQVLKSLNHFSRLGDNGSVENSSFILAEYVVDQTVRHERILGMDQDLADLQHQYSIQVSAEIAKEHEALISRGLEGLQSYEDNGITPDQIANLIRAAQTVALAFITAGVF
jgi:hypothetical protein